ncbi:MAG: hypothetical protein GX154_06005 [Clostridiales bacterium]|nr:hypothetical protein [Clostridiales bacterium]
MKVFINPEKKYSSTGKKDERLSVRITMSVESESQIEVIQLRRKWDELKENDSAEAVLQLIKEMNK